MAAKHHKWHGRVEDARGECAVPGCRERGEFRAPLTPGGFDGPGAYRLLCLDHVRVHNARYNYFAGMTPDEIEAAQSPIPGWAQTSRGFASLGTERGPAWRDFDDPLDAIAARYRPERARGRIDRFTAAERSALAVMGLNDDVDRHGLRKRYSDLVRRFHPDRNGGDRSFEKKLGEVLEAYALLKTARAFA